MNLQIDLSDELTDSDDGTVTINTGSENGVWVEYTNGDEYKCNHLTGIELKKLAQE